MVAHLPSPIKRLLTLRNPNALPGPPLSKLHAVLTSTFRDARLKKAETGWLVLTVRALCWHHIKASNLLHVSDHAPSDVHIGHVESSFVNGASLRLCDYPKLH